MNDCTAYRIQRTAYSVQCTVHSCKGCMNKQITLQKKSKNRENNTHSLEDRVNGDKVKHLRLWSITIAV